MMQDYNIGFVIGQLNKVNEKLDAMQSGVSGGELMARHVATVNAAERAVVREALKELRNLNPAHALLDKAARDKIFVEGYEDWREKIEADPELVGHADGFAVIAALRALSTQIVAAVRQLAPDRLPEKYIADLWSETSVEEGKKYRWNPPKTGDDVVAKRKQVTSKAEADSLARVNAARRCWPI